MKRQKQIEESKELIATSFVNLLKEHDYKDITYSEIAVHAGVTRTTLYRHFGSKEKIILYRARKTLENLEGQTANTPQPMREFLYQRLKWIQNLPQLQILLCSREIEELLDFFIIDAHRKKIEHAVGKKYLDSPHIFHFYFGGVNRIIKEWLRSDCRESVHDIADTIISLTLTFIQSQKRGS